MLILYVTDGGGYPVNGGKKGNMRCIYQLHLSPPPHPATAYFWLLEAASCLRSWAHSRQLRLHCPRRRWWRCCRGDAHPPIRAPLAQSSRPGRPPSPRRSADTPEGWVKAGICTADNRERGVTRGKVFVSFFICADSAVSFQIPRYFSYLDTFSVRYHIRTLSFKCLSISFYALTGLTLFFWGTNTIFSWRGWYSELIYSLDSMD